jgi:hypothetical protein
VCRSTRCTAGTSKAFCSRKYIDEEELVLARKQAFMFGGDPMLIGPFLETWNRSLRQNLDSYSGGGIDTLLA